MSDTVSTLAQKMRPFWLRDLGASTPTQSGGGSGMIAHALNGPYHTGTLDPSQAPWALTTARTLTAGAGLTGGGDLSADRSFAVGAGTLITVGADDVGITAGANYQFVGTGAGTAAAWQNISGLAGSGLTAATGVLAVGVANTGATGLSVEADAVRLTSSSNPGQAASVLATSAAGLLTLYNGAFTQAAQSEATFASGFAGSGWRADYGITTASRASIETDDLTVRGRMRVYELLIQQIRATNGSLFVSSASKVVSASGSSNPLWTVNGSQLTFNGQAARLTFTLYTISTAAAGDTSRELYHGFLPGDLTRAQQVQWNGSAFAGVIQSNLEVTSVTNLYTYGAAFVSGDAPAVGYDYVRLGNAIDTSRQGSVYITSDDSAAPFIDIVDGVTAHSMWNSANVARVRVGKLTGISDVDFGGSLSGYGLYGNNVYLKGQIVVTGGNLGGLAATDVNSNTTTINGGQITANSVTVNQIAANTITADRLNVTTLSAINANMGSLTSGSIVIGSTNKIWLNDSADGALNIGGSTKASAPFRVTAAGALTATNATVTGAITADSGYIGTQATGWVVGSGALTSTNIGLYAGAANTARVQVGSGSGLGGINTPNISSDIVFWAGNTHANRSTAAFRVDAAGQMTAADVILSSSINISGSANITGTLTAGGNPANVRLSTDGQRFVLPNLSSPNAITYIPTSSSALRWFAGLNDTWTSAAN